MSDLDKALAEIGQIRSQIARGTEFRGYGPSTVAATGVLALIAALGQAQLIDDPVGRIAAYLALWVATAAASAIIIAVEAVTRSRRIHSGLAQEMIQSAVEQFLPALVAGVLLTAVLLRFAPETVWMLPGLWQIMFGLGVFASCRFLPRPMFAVGVWYLAAGLACLAIESLHQSLSPWSMGIPFGVGQLLVAFILQYNYGDSFEEG